MPDPFLIALFGAAVRAARGDDLLAAHTTVSGDTWRYVGPGGALVFHPLCGGMDPELAWSSLRLFEAEALPAIRAG